MISVIIITRNEERNIERTITSLQSELISQIIIVDSMSTDSTLKIVENLALSDKRIEYYTINAELLTAAAGRQEGISHIDWKNKYTLFIDGDMELIDSFLSKATTILEVSDIVGITGQRTDFVYNSRGILIKKIEDFYDVNKEMFLGGAFLVENTSLKEYGKFDVKFPVLEETFFYQRFTSQGKSFIRIPDKMFIHHMLSTTSKQHWFKRIFDKKFEAYGLILSHIQSNQTSLFGYRLRKMINCWLIFFAFSIVLLLSSPIIAFTLFTFSLFLIRASVGDVLRALLFLIFLPVGLARGTLLPKENALK